MSSRKLWKPVVGFEGAYEVSDHGDVRSIDRTWTQVSRFGTLHEHTCKGRILRAGIGSNGYLTVTLGRGNSRTVHSLVAAAFIGPRPDGCEVLHCDGTRTNNHVSNLRYGTRTENILDAVRSGTWVTAERRAGMDKGRKNRWEAYRAKTFS